MFNTESLYIHTALANGLKDLLLQLTQKLALHQDIRSLVQAGLTNADSIEKRAQEALSGFVGNVAFLKLNIRDAVALARAAEQQIHNI